MGQSRTNLSLNFWICLVLLAATAAIYAPVRHFGFVNLDDDAYITLNRHVRDGLNIAGLKWAFTSLDQGYWFPITRLSYLFDFQLSAMRAGSYHLTNLFFHLLTIALLFAFLLRATAARWPAAFVAFLFALHPLHVESVAWVTERKDVLSAFFWFLTLWNWVRYTERPGVGRYLWSLVPFTLGLMSKPMLVSMPFVLLLLDFWPLGRQFSKKLLLEQVPFLGLAAVNAVTTYFMQMTSGGMHFLGPLPLSLRLENALVSTVTYILKMFWPSGLAVLYPYPRTIPLWQTGLALAALCGISALVIGSFRKRPYLLVGWCWYLVTLAPVIGIVQSGAQARADRFVYIPMVGLSIMLAWGLADVLPQQTWVRWAMGSLAVVVCAILAAITALQLPYWSDSEPLFRRAVEVTSGNYLMYVNLGNAIARDPRRLGEAAECYREAFKIKPDYADAHDNLGVALLQMPGREAAAIAEFETALRIDPKRAQAHSNLAVALMQSPTTFPQALDHLKAAVAIDPRNPLAHSNLGDYLERTGQHMEATKEFETALAINPDTAAAHRGLGVILTALPGRLPDAVTHLEQAVKISPNDSESQNALGIALAQDPLRELDALAHFQEAVRVDPLNVSAQLNLASTLARVPAQIPDAIRQLQAAIRVNPNPALQQRLDQLVAASQAAPQ